MLPARVSPSLPRGIMATSLRAGGFAYREVILMDFPHLQGSSSWPEAGRELYEQVPASGYAAAKWRDVGATVTLTSVPWGVYDPATCDDVPGFDTAAKRDEWFSKHLAATPSESVTLDTRVRYQMDDYVDVPLTFDAAAQHNYCVIEYPSAPVEYGSGGLRKWYFHVVGCDYLSPNATRIMLAHDWWVTLAPITTVSYMMLERGHAPMTAGPSVSEYLSAPISHADYLLAPDVDYGTGTARVASAKDVILNSGDMRAVICLRGISSHTAPDSIYTAAAYTHGMVWGQDVPSDVQVACAVGDLEALLTYFDTSWPSIFQAIDCVFLAPTSLLLPGVQGTLGNVTVWWGSYGASRDVSVSLSKDDFGYPAQIADFAKLYTWPYAHLTIADDRGRVTDVRVEDLAGNGVTIHEALNGAYPYLNYLAHVDGIGGARRSISFSNLNAETFPAGGRWYETLRTWGVPTWAVWQSSATTNDYATHWSRVQRRNDADTAQTNAGNSSSNITSNNAVVVAANNSLLSYSQQAALRGATLSNTKLESDQTSDLGMSSASYAADQAAIGVAMSNNDVSAVTGTVASLASGIASAATGSVSNGLTSAIMGVANSATSWLTSNASLGVSQSNSEALYTAAYQQASSKTLHATTYNTQGTTLKNSNASDNNTVTNNAMTSTASNNASLITTNASNTHANAVTAITNSINEAALQAPRSFGSYANGEQAAVRPIGLSINVITESPSAIAQAGAQFARYGYALNQQWQWSTWNTRPHFTYWKCADVWAQAPGRIPESGAMALRDMLHNGVTAWRDPDEIGQVSIYE